MYSNGNSLKLLVSVEIHIITVENWVALLQKQLNVYILEDSDILLLGSNPTEMCALANEKTWT